jgi:hypothetical protein
MSLTSRLGRGGRDPSGAERRARNHELGVVVDI